ncbi:T9SS type B sorting domain-containing protein [Tamlana sp. I1]|uniref:Ig-like domain-containing protein n=1 Tax=Tamlana sp. I1 TaxID=2762061 RepID=UPI00189085D2|nr:T9SS type B sorting domain-containing protein [Tamlana sp. I1]
MYFKLKFCIPVTILCLFISVFGQTQNVAPELTATGNQAYCPKSQIKIVTDFDIIDPDDTEIDALFVQISTGYIQGEDVLLLTGSHPAINTSWSAIEGKLTLQGFSGAAVLYSDFIAAIKDVVFESTSNQPTDKGFSITIGDANYLPQTGHYYEYVADYGITWDEAKIAAENRNYFGLQGYLATLESAEESQIAGEQASGAGWIGGTDVETEGVWKWVTGPNPGTVFWNGVVNGSTPNYANWNYNEPNNVNGGEDYAHITDPSIGIRGAWNDLRAEGDPPGVYHPKGYIVEYGGMPGDPTLNISTSTTIYTTTITSSTPGSVCESGSVILEATASQSADVLWFDAQTGGTPLDSGLTFTTPILNTSTTYYALASINGCLEGPRTPVVATVKPLPEILSVTDDLVCESGSGTLSATTSQGDINWYDVPSGGVSLYTGWAFTTPVLNTTTTYYVESVFNGCVSSNRTPVTLTVQKTVAPTGNANQRFCDIEKAKVSDLIVSGSHVLWYLSDVDTMPIDPSEQLISGDYYASQTVNSCESVNRFLVNVTVDETVVPPIASDIPLIDVCDDSLDGDDTNGFSTFNLTQNESTILNGKPAADFTFQYYTDAMYATPISTPENAFVNTVQNEQIIYVRVVNNINATCFTDTSFNIRVNPLPVIENNIVYKNCDEDGVSDGYTDFNLNEANDAVTNNNSDNVVVSYHLTVSDANQNIHPVNNSAFNNLIANTVYARVESVYGCFRICTVNLEVSTTSFPPGFLLESSTSDDDGVNDGFHEFDLNAMSPDFIAQFPAGQNLVVHYYRTLNDAELEENEILNTSQYVNETAYSQQLYVRVESGDNGDCFGLGPHLLLTVHDFPEFEIDQSATYCSDNTPITLFIYNANGTYTYVWEDENGTVVSTQPTATVNSGGVYTATATTNLGNESLPIAYQVLESEIADISLDDVTIVELSDNNSIEINNSNNNLGIGDYEFALDDINGPYHDQPYFNHVAAGTHTIFVKDKYQCGIAQLDIFILGFPKYFTPNGDGINDTWGVNGLSDDYASASKVTIYNRYGKLIKFLSAKNGFWDGSFNGQLLPNSDYWFVAELVDGMGSTKVFKGHFSLVR